MYTTHCLPRPFYLVSNTAFSRQNTKGIIKINFSDPQIRRNMDATQSIPNLPPTKALTRYQSPVPRLSWRII